MKVAVATTMAAYVTDQADTCLAWLYTAEGLRTEAAKVGCEVDFFVALEVDARGLAPFAPVTTRLAELDGSHWTFSLDDGSTEKSTASRLRFITFGQNLTIDYALSTGASHLLFMAADCQPPADAIPKLLEVDRALVGGHVSTYCLDGPRVPDSPLDIRTHMPTAAFVLLSRDLFRRVRWRYDPDMNMSDDPCLYWDARNLGLEPVVRHDVVGKHFPEAVGAIETRGHDMRVVWTLAEGGVVDGTQITIVGETGCDLYFPQRKCMP